MHKQGLLQAKMGQNTYMGKTLVFCSHLGVGGFNHIKSIYEFRDLKMGGNSSSLLIKARV